MLQPATRSFTTNHGRGRSFHALSPRGTCFCLCSPVHPNSSNTIPPCALFSSSALLRSFSHGPSSPHTPSYSYLSASLISHSSTAHIHAASQSRRLLPISSHFGVSTSASDARFSSENITPRLEHAIGLLNTPQAHTIQLSLPGFASSRSPSFPHTSLSRAGLPVTAPSRSDTGFSWHHHHMFPDLSTCHHLVHNSARKPMSPPPQASQDYLPSCFPKKRWMLRVGQQ